jgi:hypothetical protein
MMLVASPSTQKGGKAIFMLVPRPAENVDGIPIPKQAAPDTILTSVYTGGKVSFVLVPRPVEETDGIPVQKSVQQETETLVDPTQSADPNPMILVATQITHKGDKVTLTLVPKPVENVDVIPTTKTTPDLILVAHPSPDGGKPILTWVPRPAPSLADHSS